jgi:uncharacterized protein YndB with AHSA1/START domain
MGTFRLAVDITRPPSEVFAFIAEPRNMPRWYDAVDHVAQTTAGPHSIGARYDVTRSLPGGQVHNDVEITEHNANRLVTLESRAGPTPFRYRYELQPNGPGTQTREYPATGHAAAASGGWLDAAGEVSA